MARGVSSVRHNRRGANAMRRGQAAAIGAADPPSYLVPDTYTFTAPADGAYKFVLWGGGGSVSAAFNGSRGGAGSGAYAEYTRVMQAGETATIVVGAGAVGQVATAGGGGDTTITFGDGYQVKAGGGGPGVLGAAGAGGVASGGDVNLNGSAGGAVGTNGNAGSGTGGGAGGTQVSGSGGGAGAPANLPYKGGAGVHPQQPGANAPPAIVGAGGAASVSTDTCHNCQIGGDGAVLANYLGAAS